MSSLMEFVCRARNADALHELLDNHQNQIRGWTVNDFNSAVLMKNMYVLRTTVQFVAISWR